MVGTFGIASLDEPSADESVSDADLARGAQADREAFVVLYRRYVESIYRFCYRRLGNREDAEDAAAVVFERALTSIDRFRGGSVRAWLFAIADRHTIDHLRARRPTAPIDAALEVPDGSASPEDAALRADAAARLNALLQGLTPDQRRIVELRLSGLNGWEIAEIVGRSRNAVDALQFRAFSRLRRLGLRTEDRDETLG